MALIDLAGQRFGKLLVIERAGTVRYAGQTKPQWLCKCDCGKETVTSGERLRKGQTQSCGCLMFKHNAYTGRKNRPTREYHAWRAMLNRCYNTKDRHYADYGGRGIAVCERWKEAANFLADMGPRPSPQHSLDRIDNAGNYEPGNCRWATRLEQQRNKRNNRRLAVNGVVLTVPEWAERAGISSATLHKRINAGWSPQRAVSTPSMRAQGESPKCNATCSPKPR